MVIYSRQCSVKLRQPGWISFKLNGIGFRSYSYRSRLVLSLGYSHFLSLWLVNRAKRQKVLIRRDSQQKVEELKYADPYRHRGVQNLSLVYQTKEGKKR